MAEGRSRQWWAHTAALIASVYEVHRDPEKRSEPFTAKNFDPWRKRDKQPVEKAPITVLKPFFE